jgi:hypothetical protein
MLADGEEAARECVESCGLEGSSGEAEGGDVVRVEDEVVVGLVVVGPLSVAAGF